MLDNALRIAHAYKISEADCLDSCLLGGYVSAFVE
jgi:hypothetical protein